MAGAPKGGGPAFPRIRNHVDTFGSLHQESDGMSLRDWFAGQAIGDVIKSCSGDVYVMATFPTPEAYFARKAYQVADALLAEGQADG